VKIVCVDLFCGGGGTSGGLVDAATELGLTVELIAINHWPVAIATHSANFPWARHICARIDQVRPRDVVPGGRVHLMVAGPECTHHSVARGGRPVDDQKRVPAWGILPWLADLYVDNLIIENVPEFRSWAPLGANGKPLKSRRGETYQAFLQAIRAHGYTVAERIVCCADYGDATTRKRLFIQATRRGAPTFPLPTHSPEMEGLMFTQPWRPARTIIDWSLTGDSIFDRKKPLVTKTLRRVAAGMLKFNGIDIERFLPVCSTRHTSMEDAADLIPSTAVEGVPFLVAAGGPEGKGRQPKSLQEPLGTVLTENHDALIQPFVVAVNHGDRQTRSKELSGSNHGERRDRNRGEAASARCHSLAIPFPTVTCKNGYGLVNAYLTKYYGTSATAQSLDEPLDAVTTRDRFALIEPDLVSEEAPQQAPPRRLGRLIPLGNGLYLDIRFRMLQWHELAAAQGFPKGYVFTGNKSVKVRQIGNAVPRYSAKALCMERLQYYASVLPVRTPSLREQAALSAQQQ
jgi:DNA (cytosine-5)-methyltransferase 1